MSSAPGRRVNVVVNGRPYRVEVGDMDSSPLTVLVNGKPYTVEIDSSEAALEPVVRRAPSPQEAPLPVTPPASASAAAVRAPMPGNIVDIAVKPGDRVSRGQQLCALEAMKMKSAIRSPREGVIATAPVAEGQAVSHGDVLVTFE